MHRHHPATPAGYVKALQFDWLTPAYDFLVRWTIPEDAFRRQLIEQGRIGAGQRVLDIGCGTGSLCLQIARQHPETQVVGIDGDPRILELARGKAQAAQHAITFAEAMAFALPYPDASFDCVFSTLMLHHLTHEERRRTCAEALRVLRPGGELHVGDFGRPHNLAMQIVSWPMRVFAGHHRQDDNFQGRLPALFQEVGFEAVAETGHFSTFWGTLALYQGRKPA